MGIVRSPLCVGSRYSRDLESRSKRVWWGHDGRPRGLLSWNIRPASSVRPRARPRSSSAHRWRYSVEAPLCVRFLGADRTHARYDERHRARRPRGSGHRVRAGAPRRRAGRPAPVDGSRRSGVGAAVQVAPRAIVRDSGKSVGQVTHDLDLTETSARLGGRQESMREGAGAPKHLTNAPVAGRQRRSVGLHCSGSTSARRSHGDLACSVRFGRRFKPRKRAASCDSPAKGARLVAARRVLRFS